MATSDLIVPRFFTMTQPNEAKSKAAGRPIFDQFEAIELRFAGDRRKVSVFPAHEIEPNATRERGEETTYAEVYNKQYLKFKQSEQQDVSGTPIAELPFLTDARKRELRAVNVHSAEALAALDGQALKQIGPNGRSEKNQAAAYLASAAGTADVTAMAAEIAALKMQLQEQTALVEDYATKPKKADFQRKVEKQLRDQAEANAEPDDEPVAQPQEPAELEEVSVDDLSNEELKAYIKEQTGKPVQGNPRRETLLKQATELAEKDED